MNMLFSLYLLFNFCFFYSSSIVSQILPYVSIFEESPLSTIVVDLRPIFETLHVHPNQAALLHSQPSQPFEYMNGRIQLKSRLDREDYVRKRLCIGGNVLECNFTLTLTVNLNQPPYNYILSQPISCHDINDMVPKFSQTEAKIFLAENVPIGYRLPLETAIDLDSPPYGIEYYRLETINGYEQYQFSIVYDNQSRELELIVKEKLDREKIEKYFLKLLAIDRGYPSNVGTQILTIEIT
jgi:protocadherin delta 1